MVKSENKHEEAVCGAVHYLQPAQDSEPSMHAHSQHIKLSPPPPVSVRTNSIPATNQTPPFLPRQSLVSLA